MLAERRAAGIAAVAGAVALLVAWIAEHRLQMAPCALCLPERWPYRALVVLGLAAQLVPARLARPLLLLCCLSLAASIGLSLTHVGVERQWWPDPLRNAWRRTSMAAAFPSVSPRCRVTPPSLVMRRTDCWHSCRCRWPRLDLIYAVLASAVIGAAWRKRRVS